MTETYQLAVQQRGSGPALVLFHGGMGCWKHWIRNVELLSEHFTVYAIDHLGYGESDDVPSDTTAEQYLDLMYRSVLGLLPDDEPLRFAGFSFGGALATHLATRLGPRISHLCLVSPAGFPPRHYTARPTRSYKEAGDDEALFRDICRHNLRVNMLSHDESVSEEAIDIQAYSVRQTRFDSRKISHSGALLDDLARLDSGCRLRVIWGEGDDAPFRPADVLIGQLQTVVPGLDLQRVERAGHWSAYENAQAVNRLMIGFFTTSQQQSLSGDSSS